MSLKDIILVAVTVPMILALTALIIAGVVVLYLDVIRPRLAEIRKEQEQAGERKAAKAPITGINFVVDIERASKVKGENGMEMRYRHQG